MTQAKTVNKEWLDFKQPQSALALPQIALDGAQEQKWTEARSKFLWECPGFCAVMYSMMNPLCRDVKAIFTDTVPIAATDGLYMMLNPVTFLKMPLGERVFAMAHEVVHAICNHPALLYQYIMRGKVSFSDGQSLPFNNDLFQMAADFVVNAILVSGKIGVAPDFCCLDPWYRQSNAPGEPLISHKDSIADAYRKLWRDMPCNGGRGKLGVDGKRALDIVMVPGKAEGKPAEVAKQQRNEQEWKTAVAAAMESARVQGKLPQSLQDLFGEVLEPRVSWQEYIHGFFRRKLGGGAYNFRRADRRLIVRDIYAPARSGFGADTVVVAVDTSESIGKDEVTLFFGEMAGILEDVNPERLIVMWCDAKVHRVDEPEDTSDLNDMYQKGAPGRGGTSFIPVFEKVREMGITPCALVYLTDGQGSFPQAVDYPVLWGSILEPPEHYPFGEVVMIPKVQKHGG
jgi:predicted metal-dependent peptidase